MIEADFSNLFNAMNRTLRITSNHSALFQRVGLIAQMQVKNRIMNTKQDPDGHAWAPHKKPQKNSLLYKSGNLYNSINKTVGPKGVDIGTNVNYAKYLQLGTSRMVARPFMGFGENDKKQVMREFARWVNEAIG